MKNVRALLSLIVMMLLTASAYAHPGHGHHLDAPQGLMHYLTSPVHLVSILVVLSLVVYVSYRKGLLPFKPDERRHTK
jgi:hydrogenase/urease accessory protein HupE